MDYRHHRLYPEICRVIGDTVVEIHEFGLDPKPIVIAGMLRTALASSHCDYSPDTREAMTVAVDMMSDALE